MQATYGMKKPLVGPPRRPTLLRVEDPALAAEVRTRVPDLVVEIGVTPALHEFTAKLSEGVAGMGEEFTASYFEDGRVALPDLQHLFAAAEALYSVEPWLLVHDEQVLRLDIPALGIEGAAVMISRGRFGCRFLMGVRRSNRAADPLQNRLETPSPSIPETRLVPAAVARSTRSAV